MTITLAVFNALPATFTVKALPETAKAATDVAKRNAWRARTDAERAIAHDIPDPEVYARYVPLAVADVLRQAHFKNNNSYEVAVQYASELRSFGLVEYGGRCLTAFGIAVRRALVADDE